LDAWAHRCHPAEMHRSGGQVSAFKESNRHTCLWVDGGLTSYIGLGITNKRSDASPPLSLTRHQMATLSNSEAEQLRLVTRQYARGAPPIIGLVGLSGVGKSSTINRMFGTALPVSHTAACTKQLTSMDFELKINSGPAVSQIVALKVVDAPGLGESISTDPAYLPMYDDHLSASDVILWVMSARNRAVALDQRYLERYKRVSNRIVFGINQLDLVHPMNWRAESNLPSREMKENIEAIVIDRTAKLSEVLPEPPEVVAYSAETGFNLQVLFTRLLSRVPQERKWLYEGLKAFNFRDFYPTK
jgi:uncharacterized protein